MKLTLRSLLMICFVAVALPHYGHGLNSIQLDKIVQQQEASIIPFLGITPFEFEPFPIALWPELHPASGMLNATFVAIIPHGQIYSKGAILGLVMAHETLIEDFIWPSKARFTARHHNFNIHQAVKAKKISGSVAVIAQEGKAYAHWILETLARLAMLELCGIEYDFLYAPLDKPFKKETLQLWGIDEEKIIEPLPAHQYLEADLLIAPSLVGRKHPTIDSKPLFCLYPQPILIEYVRNKFLSLPELQTVDTNNHAKRIFISRKDTKLRNMINEDEIFELFQAYGFERYDLASLPVLHQIALFHNAEMVVGSHGSGLTNILFCKPGTQIIEIFQTRGDCSFWYLSQLLNLHHTCVPTAPLSIVNSAQATYVDPTIIQGLLHHLFG